MSNIQDYLRRKMLSRAHLLIQMDLEDLKEKPCEGIEVDLVSPDDVYTWTVKIKGNQGSSWEGGIFILILRFGEQYNDVPPEVFFYTVPFHPNVDPVSGNVAVDLLDAIPWGNSRSIIDLLSAIKNLLSDPVLGRNILNKQAREMCIKSPHAYTQVITDCVRHSQQIELGYDLDIVNEGKSVSPNPTLIENSENMQETVSRYKRNVSFQDYHFTWSDIATCKGRGNSVNSYLESLKRNSRLYQIHTGQKLEGLEEEDSLDLQEELSSLIYGNFKSTKMKDDKKKQRLENLRKMKSLYLHTSSDQMNGAQKNSSVRLEPNDNEVNDLLKWSSNLDSSLIDNH